LGYSMHKQSSSKAVKLQRQKTDGLGRIGLWPWRRHFRAKTPFGAPCTVATRPLLATNWTSCQSHIPDGPASKCSRRTQPSSRLTKRPNETSRPWAHDHCAAAVRVMWSTSLVSMHALIVQLLGRAGRSRCHREWHRSRQRGLVRVGRQCFGAKRIPEVARRPKTSSVQSRPFATGSAGCR
jgi:hypothetical protein